MLSLCLCSCQSCPTTPQQPGALWESWRASPCPQGAEVANCQSQAASCAGTSHMLHRVECCMCTSTQNPHTSRKHGQYHYYPYMLMQKLRQGEGKQTQAGLRGHTLRRVITLQSHLSQKSPWPSQRAQCPGHLHYSTYPYQAAIVRLGRRLAGFDSWHHSLEGGEHWGKLLGV